MVQQRYMGTIKNQKCFKILILVVSACLILMSLQIPIKPNYKNIFENLKYDLNTDLKLLLQNASPSTVHYNNSPRKYLVNSFKCKIPNLDPFNSEIMTFYNPQKHVNCTDKPLLTHVTKKNNVATLHIDERYKHYYGRGIHCCFSYFSRGETDLDLNKDWCIEFKDKVVLKKSTILVICVDENSDKVYENVHTTIIMNDEIEKKIRKHKNRQPLSVLLVGIDSISRMNFFRSLPKTHIFLKEKNWLDFQGYNKINDNTFSNLMAILSGLDETAAYQICNPKVLGMLDKCNLIWYDYRRLGFVTAYAESEAHTMHTFNWHKKGFKHDPTDYYFRSYVYGSEKYLDCKEVDDVSHYCTGPENEDERIINVARDFYSTFKNYSTFSLFWMNSCHNDINAVSRMDNKILDFLKDITEAKIVDNSVVIFLSDHGFRFGGVTNTHAGWLEERLPFFYMSLPKWFKRKYPEKHRNLIRNTNKLTSPYDLHMTLQEILVLSGEKYTVKKSSGCLNCKSLFSEIESERSCHDAGIPIHWCTCGGYFIISSKSLLAEEAAKFVISKIHKATFNWGGDFDLCRNFELTQVISAGLSDTFNVKNQDKIYLLVTFKTYPMAMFQATLSIKLNVSRPTFKMEGGISRLDWYGHVAQCADDANLKKYCYCKISLIYLFKSLKELLFTLF